MAIETLNDLQGLTTRLVIRQWPLTHSLTAAYSTVLPDFKGPCRVELCNGKLAVFPNYQAAASAAGYAINGLIGGYEEATVMPAQPDDKITHQTADDWIFEY